MIFPCIELLFVIFQVFHDFQSLWEPCMVDVLKFLTLVACPKKIKQTEQTQIRLLLKKQSDQGLPCLLFWQAFLNSSCGNNFILEQKEKSALKLF